jgi:hypothetical protein
LLPKIPTCRAHQWERAYGGLFSPEGAIVANSSFGKSYGERLRAGSELPATHPSSYRITKEGEIPCTVPCPSDREDQKAAEEKEDQKKDTEEREDQRCGGAS